MQVKVKCIFMSELSKKLLFQYIIYVSQIWK